MAITVPSTINLEKFRFTAPTASKKPNNPDPVPYRKVVLELTMDWDTQQRAEKKEKFLEVTVLCERNLETAVPYLRKRRRYDLVDDSFSIGWLQCCRWSWGTECLGWG